MAVPPTVPLVPASLYVGDLHADTSDGELFDAFSEFKSLTSVRICRDSSSGRSLFYGYVNFITHQDGNYSYRSVVFSHCRSVTFSLFVLSLPLFGSLESFEKQNKSKFLEWIDFALFWIMTIREHKS